MNGIHDMGGMHGFGAIDPGAGYAFRDNWEKRLFGVFFLAMGEGHFNIDEARFSIENVSPEDYLGKSYYARWLDTLEKQLITKGLVTQAELNARYAALSEAEI